jgi:hypothetical protein
MRGGAVEYVRASTTVIRGLVAAARSTSVITDAAASTTNVRVNMRFACGGSVSRSERDGM